MSLFKQIKKSLNFIEGKRRSKNPLFLLLVLLKDIAWVFCYFIPNKFIIAYKNSDNVLFFFTHILTKKYRKNIKTHFKISFCITCMDRLDYLKKTLKKNIKNNSAYPNIEFVLLDYNSRDGLEKWVFKKFKKELASNTLVYYQTIEPKYFHMAKAKNIAHLLASGDVVCNLDADNYTGRDFAFFINSTMQSSVDVIGAYQKGGENDPDFMKSCGGKIFLTKDNFLKLGGYDENFVGWGYEDDDFRERACNLGLKKILAPYFFLSIINHDNAVREKNMEISMDDSSKINKAILRDTENSKKIYIKNEPIDFTKIQRIK